MKSRLKAALILVGLCTTACASSLEQTVLSIANAECKSCGMMTAEELTDMPDVERAQFNVDKVEVTVFHKAGALSGEELIKRLDWLNYDLRAGPGQGFYKKRAAFKENLDVKVIVTDGSAVDLKSHLVSGKVTVVDFFAEWCGPCRTIDEIMMGILEANADVAFRKVNIIDWDSDAAKQHLADVSNIPHIMVFTAAGELLTEISGVKKDELEKAIEQARGKK